MTARWKVIGSIVLSLVVLVSVGAVLFSNGYGPLALADRPGRLGTSEAKSRIDRVLRATMDGISPSLAYAGADFEVMRKHDLWDGEPSMRSDVTEIVTARTVVSRAKLPTLMDQVARTWKTLGNSMPPPPNDPSDEIQELRGIGEDGGETLLTLYAKAQADSTYLVNIRAEASNVLYQPAHEYEPVSPLARTPRDARGYVITDPVTDPYWSH
ncbi:hypothetical protein BX285_0486 [Streptomyces sp. 1114.5]|uniref:hypothetical protein n=1 Tax=Streptomyces sp. 1114.5 TaxID=1938830 RepID=UPI000EAFAAB1|nr:hypothetical protein [Streptomyces sp. 1114.5]RKT16160.1 hypothetical protein BX285_0486 [Streptomyces sp. 1114.5]